VFAAVPILVEEAADASTTSVENPCANYTGRDVTAAEEFTHRIPKPL